MNWVFFYRCPNTGKVIRGVKTGFRKVKEVPCDCGISNPKSPKDRTPETGTHLARFVESATEDEIVADAPVMRIVYDALSKSKRKS
jgi:hypothetical protein